MDKKTARRTDRFCQLAVAAAKEAVAHARLEIEPEADRIGASIATGIGGLDTLHDGAPAPVRRRASSASRRSGCRR